MESIVVYSLTNYSLAFFLSLSLVISKEFYDKYRQEKNRVSFYWMLTFMMFVLASAITIGFSLFPDESQLLECYHKGQPYTLAFGSIGVGFIAISLFTIDLFPRQRVLEISGWIFLPIMGICVISPITYPITRVLLAFYSLVAMSGYTYLAIKGKDLRLLIVDAFIILMALIGVLQSTEVFSVLEVNLSRLGVILGFYLFRKLVKD